MIIYDYFRSSASFRLRIALNLKQLTAERRGVHLVRGEQKQAAYREVNPQGLVPFLVDGDLGLSQSLAIIEYLEEKYPTPPLLPADIESRAFARQIAQLIACDIHPLNNTRVLAYLSDPLKLDESARTRWYCGWIHEGFAALEAMLKRRAVQSPFCVGDFPTIADICLVPQVTNAQRFSCALDPFPMIMAIYDRAMQLPAFADAHPSRQPDAS
ncbi:MAG: maleylacetoacetate isomerase [Burkholderiales bacterium]|jgi:maleylacetoacetate isomerase|nr:maleylacetoacetate isomerase [Nitrosomonadaceae bacterium]